MIADIKIDKKSKFYKNCVKQRKTLAKICSDCPFRETIEKFEENFEQCSCPKECDCEDPEPKNSGIALLSNMCPVHNINPDPAEGCPIHDNR